MNAKHAGEYEQALIATARPYWDAEAEIPRRFVANQPSREDYITYLTSAVYKELNPAIGYAPPEGYACNLHREFAVLVDQFPDLERRRRTDRRGNYVDRQPGGDSGDIGSRGDEFGRLADRAATVGSGV